MKNKRDVAKETSKVRIGNSVAASSHEALYYHLISPHTLMRLAKRLTDGGKKYGTMQWRQGINDAEYVRDRFNHLFQHVLNAMMTGNKEDDNFGAILWSVNALCEVERLAPEALSHVVGSCDLFGEAATAFHKEEMERKSGVKK